MTTAHLNTGTAHAVDLRTQNSVKADIEFGTMNRDGDCVNNGICRIQAVRRNRPQARRCHRAGALLCVGREGRLQIFFPRAAMMPCTERAFFAPYLFPVPVAYALPQPLSDRLEGLLQTIIVPGVYPIRRTAAGYQIEF